MRKFLLATGAAALSLALVACQAPETNTQADANAAIDESTPEGQVRANEAQWNRDWASRDVGAILAHWAADATVIVANAPPMTGHAAIRPLVEQLAGDANFSLTFQPDRVTASEAGDLVVTRGAYTMRSTNPDTRAAQTETGGYVTAYRRNSSGGWEAFEDIISPGPLATATAATAAPAGNEAAPANDSEPAGNDAAPPANTVGM